MHYTENPKEVIQKIRNFLNDEVNNHIKSCWFETGIYYPIGKSVNTPEYYYTITVHNGEQQKQLFKSYADGVNIGSYGMMQRFIDYWANKSWQYTTCSSANEYAKMLMSAFMDTDSFAGNQHKSRKARMIEYQQEQDKIKMQEQVVTNQINYSYSAIEKDIAQAILKELMAGKVLFEDGEFSWRHFISGFNKPETEETLKKLEEKSYSNLKNALENTLNKIIKALIQRGQPVFSGVLDGTYEDNDGMLHYEDNAHLCYHKDFDELINIMSQASKDYDRPDSCVVITKYSIKNEKLEEEVLDYQEALLTRLKHSCVLELEVKDLHETIMIEYNADENTYTVHTSYNMYDGNSLSNVLDGFVDKEYISRVIIKGTTITLKEALESPFIYNIYIKSQYSKNR